MHQASDIQRNNRVDGVVSRLNDQGRQQQPQNQLPALKLLHRILKAGPLLAFNRHEVVFMDKEDRQDEADEKQGPGNKEGYPVAEGLR